MTIEYKPITYFCLDATRNVGIIPSSESIIIFLSFTYLYFWLKSKVMHGCMGAWEGSSANVIALSTYKIEKFILFGIGHFDIREIKIQK